MFQALIGYPILLGFRGVGKKKEAQTRQLEEVWEITNTALVVTQENVQEIRRASYPRSQANIPALQNGWEGLDLGTGMLLHQPIEASFLRSRWNLGCRSCSLRREGVRRLNHHHPSDEKNWKWWDGNDSPSPMQSISWGFHTQDRRSLWLETKGICTACLVPRRIHWWWSLLRSSSLTWLPCYIELFPTLIRLSGPYLKVCSGYPHWWHSVMKVPAKAGKVEPKILRPHSWLQFCLDHTDKGENEYKLYL